MTMPADQRDEPSRSDPGSGLIGRALIGLGLAGLIGAGAVMWMRHGESVFADLVSAAIAWCM